MGRAAWAIWRGLASALAVLRVGPGAAGLFQLFGYLQAAVGSEAAQRCAWLISQRHR
jgi:hypothetical protein